MSLTVACVLRSGGVYTEEYVERLYYGVAEHLDGYDFVCLSDTPLRVPWIPLKTDWPRNFAKIELFTPGLFTGKVLFLDLDTDVVGDLSDIAACDSEFAMIDDWLRPAWGASGVMVWHETERTRGIYHGFRTSYPGVLDSYTRDQRWIHLSVGTFDPLRAMYPGQIVSRWAECRFSVPDDARLICWHGTPRPHEIGWDQTGHDEKRSWTWWRKMVQMGYVDDAELCDDCGKLICDEVCA